MPTKPFETLDPEALATVAGGASRVSSRSGSSDQLTAMLTQITSSIKDLAGKQSGGMDPMMMMMMMMMGGGGGGGAGVGAGAAVSAATPTINVDATGVGGGGGGCGGRGKGKKGW